MECRRMKERFARMPCALFAPALIDYSQYTTLKGFPHSKFGCFWKNPQQTFQTANGRVD